jgi:lysophospholipase L1-like esterase
VRFLGYGLTRLFVPDDLLGHRLPTASAVVHLDHSNKYLYITDDNGFIVDVDDLPVAPQKPVNTYRVIVLGGSTVMGQGAPRPSQNLVGMLRKAVRERGLTGPNGKRVEFINAGVYAYTSAQEYLYLVADLLRFRPDLVVVYDGWNDIYSDYQSAHSNAERLTWSYSIAGSARLLAENLRYFLTESDFRLGMAELPWRVLHGVSDRLSSYLSHKSDEKQSEFVSKPLDARATENYSRNRRAFLALADDQLSVALFLQPLVGMDDRTLSAEEKASWWYPQLDIGYKKIPFYEHARQILEDLKERNQDNGHYCIADLSHSLNGVSEAVYADHGHLLPRGNEVVAAHMLDKLVSCGFLR